MWQNNGMYGGCYARPYGYNPAYGANSMNMARPNTAGYGQQGGHYFSNNGYNSRQTPLLQMEQQLYTTQQQQQQQQSDESQIRRLSRGAEVNGASSSVNADNYGGTRWVSGAATPHLASADASAAYRSTQTPDPQKENYVEQTPHLQRNTSMHLGSYGRYGLRPHTTTGVRVLPQSTNGYGASQLGAQRAGSFHRATNGFTSDDYDVVAIQRIDSGFDSIPRSGLHAPGELVRQYSSLGRVGSGYDFGSRQGFTSRGDDAAAGGDLQRIGSSLGQGGGAGNTSLYRIYSFSNGSSGGGGAAGLSRGFSGYGSLYGGRNLYGGSSAVGGGDVNPNTSLYGTASFANLRPTYSFAGNATQNYGSGFAFHDHATEANEFAADVPAPNSWGAASSAENTVPYFGLPSPSSATAPGNRYSGSAPRQRSHSAPMERPASHGTTPASAGGDGSVVRKRRVRPQKRVKSEGAVEGSSYRPPVVLTETSPTPALEEEMMPMKRLASAPTSRSRTPVTPFEHMRALRRAQTAAYSTTPTPQSSLPETTIGRRRGSTGGLYFSGAAVV